MRSLELIHFLFLFSILTKLFDRQIVNCEIIHYASMLIYTLTSENDTKHQKFQQKSEIFLTNLNQKIRGKQFFRNFWKFIFIGRRRVKQLLQEPPEF